MSKVSNDKQLVENWSKIVDRSLNNTQQLDEIAPLLARGAAMAGRGLAKVAKPLVQKAGQAIGKGLNVAKAGAKNIANNALQGAKEVGKQALGAMFTGDEQKDAQQTQQEVAPQQQQQQGQQSVEQQLAELEKQKADIEAKIAQLSGQQAPQQ